MGEPAKFGCSTGRSEYRPLRSAVRYRSVCGAPGGFGRRRRWQPTGGVVWHCWLLGVVSGPALVRRSAVSPFRFSGPTSLAHRDQLSPTATGLPSVATVRPRPPLVRHARRSDCVAGTVRLLRASLNTLVATATHVYNRRWESIAASSPSLSALGESCN